MPQGIRVVSDVFEGIYYTFWHFESVIGAWVLNTVVIPNFQYGWWLVPSCWKEGTVGMIDDINLYAHVQQRARSVQAQTSKITSKNL